MNVLNLHGFQGCRHDFAYEALTANGCKVISPALGYDAESPLCILSRLRRIARVYQIQMIAGTSLGGFYAAVLSAELHLPVILVNPFLLPFLSSPDYTAQYIALFGGLARLEQRNVSCIVGAEDDCIGSFDFVQNLLGNERFRIVQDGTHSGGSLSLKEFFGEVLRLYSCESDAFRTL